MEDPVAALTIPGNSNIEAPPAATAAKKLVRESNDDDEEEEERDAFFISFLLLLLLFPNGKLNAAVPWFLTRLEEASNARPIQMVFPNMVVILGQVLNACLALFFCGKFCCMF
jgi:hypothetical protein